MLVSVLIELPEIVFFCLVQTNSGDVTEISEVCSSGHLHRNPQVFIVRNHLSQEVEDRLQILVSIAIHPTPANGNLADHAPLVQSCHRCQSDPAVAGRPSTPYRTPAQLRGRAKGRRRAARP